MLLFCFWLSNKGVKCHLTLGHIVTACNKIYDKLIVLNLVINRYTNTFDVTYMANYTNNTQGMSCLTLSQTTNFRVFQTERVIEMTISCLMKMAESSQKE